MRFWTAIRAFFRVLFDLRVAQQVETLLTGGSTESPQPVATAVPPPSREPPRSEALTLLAALEREARFVDFVQESLDDYSDAQIGAAARDVHRGCGKVLSRMFDLRPLVDEAEGAEVEVPAGFDPACYHLTGNVSSEPPLRGRLVHHGWSASRCELPCWSGSSGSTLVVAPAEVEIR